MCTKVLKPPSLITEREAEKCKNVTEQKSMELEETKCEEKIIIPSSLALSKKRKFSFKQGKLSVTEVPAGEAQPDNIYLEVEGKEIAVEEKILTSSSRHFSRIIDDISMNSNSEYLLTEEDGDEEEEDNPLAAISFETVEKLTDFIAKKESALNLSDSNVGSFQHVARLLTIGSVEKLCKKFVKSGLSAENCLQRFGLADSFLGWADTANIIQTFIEHHFSEILANHREEFLTSMNEIELKRIIASNNLQIKSEDEVAEAVLAWVEQDVEGREHCLAPLLEEVQFHCLSGQQFIRTLAGHKLISSDSHCVEIVGQAAAYHSLSYEEKVAYWDTEPKPGRWPQILVALSYAEKTLEFYDFVEEKWDVLTEKPDWVFGAEMVGCGGKLYTVGGVSSRQVDKYDPETDDWTDGA